MKLSPMIQYRIAFWSVTTPLLFPMTVVLILAIFNPFWFRDDMLRWAERLAGKWGKWRDDLSFVKSSYDKAHLFDTLKNSGT